MTDHDVAVQVWRNTVRNALFFGIIVAVCIWIGGLVAKIAFCGFVLLVVFELITSIPAIGIGVAIPFVPGLRKAVDSVGWSLVGTLGKVVDDGVAVLLAYLLYRAW